MNPNDNSRYINREISWLSFNERVLQEAKDKTVPLIERLRFLGIFSNNLDEFFRVRVSSVRRMKGMGKKAKNQLQAKPKELLEEINTRVKQLQKQFGNIYTEIRKELEAENIFIINETQLDKGQAKEVVRYFKQKVRPQLTPIMLDYIDSVPALTESSIHLAIDIKNKGEDIHALIEIPDSISRFLVLPSEDEKRYIILLDDIIRYNLDDIFKHFSYESIKAYTIKITLDAELDIDHDISKSLIEKIEKSVKGREKAKPIRFIYDAEISEELLDYLLNKMELTLNESNIGGARYHNFKDFMGFPPLGKNKLSYKSIKELKSQAFDDANSIFSALQSQDVLLHYPYHRFSYVIDMLREAAMSPYVTTIKMTLYRVASNSMIAKALINAAKNGKKVIAVVEIRARFDEASNIYWAKKMQEEGVQVIYGVPGLKVHSKLCLVTYIKDGKRTRFANFSTGNFNEKTAKIYSDMSLFTADERLTYEANKVFQFFENNYKVYDYQHLLVSPHGNRVGFEKLIDHEINNAKNGITACITAKMNSLVDKKMIEKLYEASNAGVKVRLIVRGICCLVPQIKGQSENIEVISIVDKYLEHARVFVFENGGEKKYFLSSADWMKRNLDLRVEVTFPIYDKNLQQEIDDYIEIQWTDDTKARIIDAKQQNEYRETAIQRRAQIDFYEYLKNKPKT